MLDTNTCIYIIRKKPPEVFSRLRRMNLNEISLSVITLSELYYGAVKSSNYTKNLIALKNFIKPFCVFDFDFSAVEEYGHVRSQLERKGLPIGPLDTLIAAHAKSLNLTLVTNNEKEFIRVDDLKIENWINKT